MNKQKFFEFIRKNGILGELSQSEVDGVNYLLDALAKGNYPVSWAAYALATAYHETAGTMLPISEMGGNAYYTKLYGVEGRNPERAKKHGNTKPGDGAKYHGRGYVQLTWKINYQKAGNKLGVDLVNQPNLAKDPKIAADVLVIGMNEGWFTGVSNKTFMPNNRPATLAEFMAARKIINGTDKAEKIARYALTFQEGLLAASW